MPILRFGFATCVQLGLSCMEEISKIGGHLDAVLTLPDDKARAKSGRVYLDGYCSEQGIALFKANSINDADALAWLRSQALDWLFIIGWSQIAKADVLASVTRGAIGMHPTLLPVGRGRASIPWAILKELPETGVSMFKLDEGVDTGPILAQEHILIESRETATMLYSKVERAHRSLIRRAWPLLAQDALPLVPQDETRATVWPGRTPSDGRLDASMLMMDADRLVRAVTRPYPGAYIDAGSTRWRIWSAIPNADAALGLSGKRLHFVDGELLALEMTEETVESEATLSAEAIQRQ